jgi:hypothetical protein
LQALDLNPVGKVGERGPAHCDIVRGQPYTAIVAELQLRDRQLRGKRTVQTRELDPARSQPLGERFDHRPACVGVAADEHDTRQYRQEQQQARDDAGGKLRCAAHQKACPKPM